MTDREQDREAFEKWMREETPLKSPLWSARNDDGSYQAPIVQNEWSIWQAATAAAAERIAELERQVRHWRDARQSALDGGDILKRDLAAAQAQLAEAVKAEREACAKVAEAKSGRYGSSEIDPIATSWNCACADCAAAIRAMQENERGELGRRRRP